MWTGIRINSPQRRGVRKTVRPYPSRSIVLLHSTSDTNGAILDELLTKWEEMGYHFATLDDI